jgi:tetratricopeptide (TPR) repeat protein
MLNHVIAKQKPSACWLNAFFFVCTGIFMLFSFVSFSQDKIYKTDGTIVEAKIQEVGEAEIKFKKFSNQNGPMYSVKKEFVKMIVYENGEKEVYNQEQPSQQVQAPIQTYIPAFDTLGYIAKYLGVILQTTTEPDGGIKIIDKVPGHRLKKGLSAGEAALGIFTAYIGFAVMGIGGEFSLNGAVITDIKIRDGEKWQWVRINKISDFTKAFCEIGRNKDEYKNVASFKIKKGISRSTGLANIADLDITPIENNAKEKARNFILSENINDAIATYAQLLAKDSVNSALLAEDAYALALGGVYDAALMRLDRIWFIGADSPDENFYTAQVFALMGYDDLAGEFWKTSDKNKTPAWISSKSAILLQKFKRKFQSSDEVTSEKLKANFKHANELADKKSYFQSIAAFRKIITVCPNEYLPYVGYSISLEQTGALEKSAQNLKTALSLIGDKAEDKEMKQLIEQQLVSVVGKMSLLPIGTMPGFPPSSSLDIKQPQMMAYAGGMMGSSTKSLNGRIGYYISQSSNASLDFGSSNSSGNSYTNLGLSVYNRKNSFVSGGGLLLSKGAESTTLYLKLSVGFSKMNQNRTSSLDIFLDVNKGLGEGAYSTWGLSLGKSIYFGKRK